MTRQDLPVLPTGPSCYLYYNDQNTVIYVGKAVNSALEGELVLRRGGGQKGEAAA